MTLSPVFRSQDAVRLLADHGVWSRLAGDIKAQAEAVQVLYKDLEGILGPDFRSEPSHTPSDSEATTTKGLMRQRTALAGPGVAPKTGSQALVPPRPSAVRRALRSSGGSRYASGH